MRFAIGAILAATCAAVDNQYKHENIFFGFIYGAAGYMPQLTETRECSEAMIYVEAQTIYLDATAETWQDTKDAFVKIADSCQVVLDQCAEAYDEVSSKFVEG